MLRTVTLAMHKHRNCTMNTEIARVKSSRKSRVVFTLICCFSSSDQKFIFHFMMKAILLAVLVVGSSSSTPLPPTRDLPISTAVDAPPPFYLDGTDWVAVGAGRVSSVNLHHTLVTSKSAHLHLMYCMNAHCTVCVCAVATHCLRHLSPNLYVQYVYRLHICLFPRTPVHIYL